MGSVSGISGSGGVYQPQEPKPDFSALKQALDAFFKDPTNMDAISKAMDSVDSMLNNPNLSNDQKKVLSDIGRQLMQFNACTVNIAKLQLEPQTPGTQAAIEANEDKQSELQMNIQSNLSQL